VEEVIGMKRFRLVRRFDGKPFRRGLSFHLKSEAEAEKRSLKERGYNVRLMRYKVPVVGGYLWCVWYRKAKNVYVR